MVTTVAPITSITAAVAGDLAVIEGLVPEGTNSHTFQPPPSASALLERADLVLVNGLQLEEPTVELAEATMSEGARLVELGTEVLPESEYLYDFSFPEEDGKPNPHLWTDPTWAIRYAELVHEHLVDLDPDNAATYDANLDAFEEQATALSEALRADQESLSAEDRVLLTYHDAYAYFAQTYDWQVIGAIQPESFEEPTPKEVARLIDQIRDQQVPTIFGSEVFPSAALEEIGRATGARDQHQQRGDDQRRGHRAQRVKPGDGERRRGRHGHRVLQRRRVRALCEHPHPRVEQDSHARQRFAEHYSRLSTLHLHSGPDSHSCEC